MLVAIEMAGWLNESNLALQAVVQCYGLVAPLIFYKIPSVPVFQVSVAVQAGIGQRWLIWLVMIYTIYKPWSNITITLHGCPVTVYFLHKIYSSSYYVCLLIDYHTKSFKPHI